MQGVANEMRANHAPWLLAMQCAVMDTVGSKGHLHHDQHHRRSSHGALPPGIIAESSAASSVGWRVCRQQLHQGALVVASLQTVDG